LISKATKEERKYKKLTIKTQIISAKLVKENFKS